MKFLKESPIFEPFRQMMSAVERLKERKNNELKEFQELKKALKNEQKKDNEIKYGR